MATVSADVTSQSGVDIDRHLIWIEAATADRERA